MRTDPELEPIAFLQLLADPLRWDLLSALARSDRRVSELTESVRRPQNLVSYHLGVLRTAGLVSSRRSSADGRDTYYRADLARCQRLLSSTATALQPGIRFEPVADAVAARPRPRRPLRVLFLCTGNSARSQIAESLTRAMSDGAVVADSAGSHPKVLHPVAVQVMAERGIDISHQAAKHLRQFRRTRFDRVITLCDRVREVCPEFPTGPERVHWSTADPAREGGGDEASLEAFERTAEELEVRIGFLLADLLGRPPAPPTPTKERVHA